VYNINQNIKRKSKSISVVAYVRLHVIETKTIKSQLHPRELNPNSA